MSHNSTSLKQLLLFLQYFKWREYEAPSTTGVFRFVLMFKQAYNRPGLWLIDPIYFPFPWNHYRDFPSPSSIWTKKILNATSNHVVFMTFCTICIFNTPSNHFFSIFCTILRKKGNVHRGLGVSTERLLFRNKPTPGMKKIIEKYQIFFIPPHMFRLTFTKNNGINCV